MRARALLLLSASLACACAPERRRGYAAAIAPGGASVFPAATPSSVPADAAEVVAVRVGAVLPTVPRGGAPLREKPAALARLVALLPPGTRVRVTEVDGLWAGVDVEGAESKGWLRTNDLVEPKPGTEGGTTVPSGGSLGTAPDARPLVEDPFFAGRGTYVPWLDLLAPHAAPRGNQIVTVRMPDAEGLVLRDLAAAGRRDVKSLFVHGVAYRVTCPPARAAEVLCDPEIEKASFGAQEGRDLGPASTGEGRRMAFGLLDMGEKPFVYDFRFALEATRVARPGGVFLVRTEMVSDPAPERVSLVVGVAVCAPDGDGTRVTEVIAIGSPVGTPFFLKGKARAAVDRILGQRANRLAAAMSR